jgi:meiotically up-regulated gene 157 (Mug157) protein
MVPTRPPSPATSGRASCGTAPCGTARLRSGPTRSTVAAGGCSWTTRTPRPAYVATRAWVLSAANPWWFRGSAAEGVGSPHTGPRRVWPIAIAVRGLTATSAAERVAAARLLGATHADTFLAHESFDVDDPGRFTRPWFAWANSLVGTLLEATALEGLLA